MGFRADGGSDTLEAVSERRPIGWKGRLLIVATALVAVAAGVGGVHFARERARRAPVLALLEDETTETNRIDHVAWVADHVGILRVTAPGAKLTLPGALAVEQRWLGYPTVDHFMKAATQLKVDLTWDSWLRVQDGRHPVRTADPSALVFFCAEVLHAEQADGIGVIESGVVLLYWDGSDSIRVREVRAGLYPCGDERIVKARVLHVAALRSALQDVGQAGDMDLLERFLSCNVRPAQFQALRFIDSWGGEPALAAFERVLENGKLSVLHNYALQMALKVKSPATVGVARRQLGRELAFWRRLTPHLTPGWLQEAPDELWSRHWTLHATLEDVTKRRDTACRDEATQLLELYATMPPSGYEYLDEATNALRQMLDAR